MQSTTSTTTMAKYLLIILLLLSTNERAAAFELAQGLTPPALQRGSFRYTGLFHENADFAQARAITDYNLLEVSAPVYKTETESVGLSFSGSQLRIRPEQNGFSSLYEIKFGANFTQVLEEKRLWSAMVNYGSASDKPFQDRSVNTLGLTALYSMPSDATSSWIFLINYSNNRPILNNIPLPGFAWFFNPSKEFRLVLGAPFAMTHWQFADQWGLNFFALVPWTIKGSIYYKIAPFAQAYTGLDFSQETYYLHGREKKEERLFYDEKKLFVGIKSPLSKTIFADFETGHAFDRSFFEAKNYQIHPDLRTELGNAYYAKLTLRLLLP